eukprot:scaffold757_cov246-Pinguiococcus_pyrenoidosus.AAC.19
MVQAPGVLLSCQALHIRNLGVIAVFSRHSLATAAAVFWQKVVRSGQKMRRVCESWKKLTEVSASLRL